MTGPLRVAQTDELLPEELAAISSLCAAAFGEPWDDAWEQVGPGIHVLLELDGRIAAHAMVVDRRLYLGHEPDLGLDVGYVEWVATDLGHTGRGHGSRVMERVDAIIGEAYVLGALSTGSRSFYERLGWEAWRGPTFVRMPDGQRVRSPEEDGGVMILRTSRTPRDLDLDGPIAVEWRPAEPW